MLRCRVTPYHRFSAAIIESVCGDSGGESSGSIHISELALNILRSGDLRLDAGDGRNTPGATSCGGGAGCRTPDEMTTAGSTSQ